MKVSLSCGRKLEDRFLGECERLGLVPSVDYLIVSILFQRLYHYTHGEIVMEYVISTSEVEASCVVDSFGTPWGMHRIEEKVGEGEEAGTVFKGRKSIGRKYWECSEHLEGERLITSRLMWLRGLEEGVNSGEGVDSYDRYIYIHGTNREHLLGLPVTLGCVTLSNEDVIRLYDSVSCGALVWIDRG